MLDAVRRHVALVASRVLYPVLAVDVSGSRADDDTTSIHEQFLCGAVR